MNYVFTYKQDNVEKRMLVRANSGDIALMHIKEHFSKRGVIDLSELSFSLEPMTEDSLGKFDGMI